MGRAINHCPAQCHSERPLASGARRRRRAARDEARGALRFPRRIEATSDPARTQRGFPNGGRDIGARDKPSLRPMSLRAPAASGCPPTRPEAHCDSLGELRPARTRRGFPNGGRDISPGLTVTAGDLSHAAGRRARHARRIAERRDISPGLTVTAGDLSHAAGRRLRCASRYCSKQ